ncbi:hypothetical protein FRC00_003094 [Tulasnella sp. 408]|nr:hypothetical protein FRC00_003094 [Tulasnella sp. 408]
MLVGLKTNIDEEGNLKWPKWLNRGLDVDVIVSEVRETSRKPDEVYGMIERMCPGGRKLGVLTVVQFIPLFVSAEDMANYVQFPSSGASPSGQYVSYGQVPAVTGQPTGNGAGPGGYGAVYPTSNPAYTNPGGSPMAPGSPQPGAQAYMNLRLADGTNTYVPVAAQMVGGRMQWITTGPGVGQPALQASPRGGEVMQAQRTGHDAQPAYADYRAAERDTGTSDRKWYQSSKKDKSSKKTREWEKEARAREEAEERQRLEIAERERIRKLSNNFERERERRASVSAEGRPSGILHHSKSGRDLDQRFGEMGLGPNAYQSASTRSRRPSTSEAENPYQRARRLSTSVPPDGHTGGDYTRQRTISGNYGAPTTPASRVGAFYPDRERALGRGEYEAPGHGRSPSGGFPMPGTLPAASYVAPDGSGRVMGGGMLVQPGAPGSGFLPAGNHSVATASPDGRLAPPTDSSSSDEESASDEEDRSDDEPAYVTKHRERRGVGSHQMPQTPYPLSRSRRNSLAAHGQLVPANTGLDVHEMWAVKSREAVKVIRARQKIEKKRRKLERRMKRRELRGEPLYSLWIVHL